MQTPIFNPTLGYDPLEGRDWITYPEWCATWGKNRWIHEDGIPRTFYDLEDNWENVYNDVCKEADIAFHFKRIYDLESFTSEFLSRVPICWEKYKAQLVLLSGSLDGTPVAPDRFDVGYERTTNSTNNRNVDNELKVDTTDTINDKIGNRSDTTTGNNSVDENGKQRSINYQQGIQAYPGISDIPIGKMGMDYATGAVDSIASNDTTSNSFTGYQQGAQENESERQANQESESKSKVAETFQETVSEKRVNFYDELAFYRTRLELMGSIEPFNYWFKDLFIRVESIGTIF